jgi:hypothetical protein
VSSSVRRDELLYESEAALRLVDRAIQEICASDGQEESAEAVTVAAGDEPVASQELNAAD